MSPAFHSNLESTNFLAQRTRLRPPSSPRPPACPIKLAEKERKVREKKEKERGRHSVRRRRPPEVLEFFCPFSHGSIRETGSVGRSVLLSFSYSTVSFMNIQWKAQGKPCQPFGSKAATVLVMKAEIFWLQLKIKVVPSPRDLG